MIEQTQAFEEQKAEVLDAFGEEIEMCRAELSQLAVLEERTYRYAIIRSYGKVLLTACEVYTLLKEGYPEGALSLARSLYEAMVIIDTLLKGSASNDDPLLERFFDAAVISQLQIDIDSAKWVISKDSDHCSAQNYLENRKKELAAYQSKYNKKSRFEDYWWAKVNSFKKLADRTDFPKDYMYIRACGNVHFNAYDILRYIDMSDHFILIGNTNKGTELPLGYASLTLYVIAGIIHAKMPDLISDVVLSRLKEVSETTTAFLVKSIDPGIM